MGCHTSKALSRSVGCEIALFQLLGSPIRVLIVLFESSGNMTQLLYILSPPNHSYNFSSNITFQIGSAASIAEMSILKWTGYTFNTFFAPERNLQGEGITRFSLFVYIVTLKIHHTSTLHPNDPILNLKWLLVLVFWKVRKSLTPLFRFWAISEFPPIFFRIWFCKSCIFSCVLLHFSIVFQNFETMRWNARLGK